MISLAVGRLAGESDLADARIGGDRTRRPSPRASDDVDDAGRDARLERELAEPDAVSGE